MAEELLTVQEFTALLGQTRGVSVSPHEKRASMRIPVKTMAQTLWLQGANGTLRRSIVRLRDISQGGVCMLLPAGEACHERGVVMMRRSSGEFVSLLFQSVWKREVGGDLFQVGAKWVRRLSRDEVDELLGGVGETVTRLLYEG